MKTLKYYFLLLLFIASAAVAQEKKNNVVYIKAERFAQPLVQKWIEQYSQIKGDVQIKLADANQEADINLLTKSPEIFSSENVIYVGRYALLPVTTVKGSALGQFSKLKLNKKTIKDLFFEDELAENDNKKITKLKEGITIYSGNKANSGSVFFASYFGYTSSDLRDKRISGDDLFLLNAIEKDLTGVTINNLTYIYDVKTRKLKNNLALLPLDIKKEYNEILASSNLDETINLLEKESIDLIPVNQIGFVYNDYTPAINEFLQWVLKEGQAFNRDFGFLTLDKASYLAQEKAINSIYLTSNNTK